MNHLPFHRTLGEESILHLPLLHLTICFVCEYLHEFDIFLGDADEFSHVCGPGLQSFVKK